MALDPAVLKARVDLRVSELKLLAAWTAVNWLGRGCAKPELLRGRVELEQLLRDLPPPSGHRNDDDE
jgi:hypothetical protein